MLGTQSCIALWHHSQGIKQGNGIHGNLLYVREGKLLLTHFSCAGDFLPPKDSKLLPMTMYSMSVRMRKWSTIQMKACLFSLPHWLYTNSLEVMSLWFFNIAQIGYFIYTTATLALVQALTASSSNFLPPSLQSIFFTLPLHVTPLLKNHQCFLTDYRIKSNLLSMTRSSFPSRSSLPLLPLQVLYDPTKTYLPLSEHPKIFI